jgi:branched-chain amino acid transport system substrate-binding protein
MYNSYSLAVDHVNAAGGVLGRKLELLPPADDGCDALMAAQAATMITSQRPDFVVGGYCSGATIPALQEFYDRDLIMLISAANSTRITDLGLNQTFMINSPGTHAIDSLVMLIKNRNASRVAIIHQGDDYTQNLSDICNQKLPPAGIRIVTTQVMEKGSPDVSAIVTAIRNAQADFVFWAGYFADGGNMIRQLRQGGYNGTICCGDGSASTELITAAGPAGEGVYVTSPPYVEFSEGGAEFLAAYRAKYNQPPDAYATLSYDTIMVLKTAIEQAGTTDFAQVRDRIQRISYKGLSGQISFAPNRELAISNFIIIQINNGAYSLIKL